MNRKDKYSAGKIPFALNTKKIQGNNGGEQDDRQNQIIRRGKKEGT